MRTAERIVELVLASSAGKLGAARPPKEATCPSFYGFFQLFGEANALAWEQWWTDNAYAFLVKDDLTGPVLAWLRSRDIFPLKKEARRAASVVDRVDEIGFRAYWVRSGCSMELRVRMSLGAKEVTITATPWPGEGLLTRAVVSFALKAQPGSDVIARAAAEVADPQAMERLRTRHAEAVQGRPAPPADVQAKVAEAQERSRQAARAAAVRRVELAIREAPDMTEEDVMQAWRMSRIKEVMSS